ncbi:MAG: hypothetical protein COV01_03075 [Candidatus Taylorbacteria bacterium CG10_big_fil_rev_8_21_14_0_10_41_48]|uniref:tRNA pseudouridine(55) synthase n=1 Tax=Candidatus Taylorbacteria bacterium CG10_big_fil_rev_8_21_14_0_10_41_48 TaxID=1975024 RepID=A0A2M8LBQ4_9BACT|nr:MAG: hypothetical protein COV01_03075 [Candidatus Taylorbacteria bacterium CG10_big_fil_rev_8_21_14_0_10_41_48]
MDTVLNLYKKHGETPLQTVERYVALHPEYTGVKMTYAGRLDPMAEGLLIVLTGEKNKERESYTGLSKVYEFEFILGIETDTYDVLGKVVSSKIIDNVSMGQIGEVIEKYQGVFEQSYPAYSSKVVAGKQLFEYARSGTINTIVLPKHTVNVTDIKLDSVRTISREEFIQSIETSVGLVQGDFRQKEIISLWKKYKEIAPDIVSVYRARVSCGSGFYVRQLVSDIGRDLGTGAVTTHILRTRVGEYRVEDSIR